jgi:hypothetical protein
MRIFVSLIFNTHTFQLQLSLYCKYDVLSRIFYEFQTILIQIDN